MGKGGKGGRQSPNDQRSNSLNPNNAAYHSFARNRSNQMNPNNPAYHSSRASSSPSGESSGVGAPITPVEREARPGCEVCVNFGPHDGPHGYFAEGDFCPFDDGAFDEEDAE